MDTKIFIEHFKYENPSVLLKDLHNSSGTRYKKKVNHVNNALSDLRNVANRNEIRENEDPDKVIDIVDEILKFNKQQKGKKNSFEASI